jgi:Ca2+-binding RTX toxin-like protein
MNQVQLKGLQAKFPAIKSVGLGYGNLAMKGLVASGNSRHVHDVEGVRPPEQSTLLYGEAHFSLHQAFVMNSSASGTGERASSMLKGWLHRDLPDPREAVFQKTVSLGEAGPYSKDQIPSDDETASPSAAVAVTGYSDPPIAVSLGAVAPVFALEIAASSTNNLSAPELVALAGGGYVAIWEADGEPEKIPEIPNPRGIYMQRLDSGGAPLAEPVRVNTSVFEGDRSYSAALADGGFVVVWCGRIVNEEPEAGLLMRRFSADGSPQGETTIIARGYFGTPPHVELQGLTGGNLAVIFMGWDGSGTGVYSRIYSPLGEPLTEQALVPDRTSGNQTQGNLEALRSGGYVVTWNQPYYGEDPGNLYLRRYDANGARLGDEVLVQDGTSSWGEEPVAELLDGTLVMVWNTGSAGDVFIRRMAADGTFIGSAERVNPETHLNGLYASVVPMDDGGFLVTWSTSGAAWWIPEVTYQKRYAADGSPVGDVTVIWAATAGISEITATEAAMDASAVPQIFGTRDKATAPMAMLPDTPSWVMAWTQSSSVSSSISMQMFTENGVPIGSGKNARSLWVQENTKAVTILRAWDPDSVSLAFSIAGGADVESFNIDRVTGELTFKTSRDHENPVDLDQNNSYEVVVQVSDGILSDSRTILVKISNLTSETIIGTAASDTLRGDIGDDILSGNGGNDLLGGNDGKDLLNGGAGADWADYADKITGEDVTVTLNGATLATVNVAGIQEDTLVNIENLAGGAGHDTFIGDGLSNWLSGREGDDFLQGRGGVDVLDGGGGTDLASFSEKAAAVVVALNGISTVTVTVGGVAEDRLRNIESLIGGAGADRLSGDGLHNYLNGSGGNDTLTGGGGSDTLIGGNGADLLRGGSGADVLYGRSGNDTLEGGAGTDWFVFDLAINASSNVDRITDFLSSADKIVLDDDIFTRFVGTSEGAAITPENYRIGAAATDADDYLIYNTSSDGLFYDADGSGAGAAIRIVTIVLAGTLAPAVENFVVIA